MSKRLRLFTGISVLVLAGRVSGLSVTIQVTDVFCIYPGCASAAVSGGVPPYTYLWSGGETTESIYSLIPGPISVTVTDFLGTQASANATVGTTAILDGFWFGTPPYCTTPLWARAATGFLAEFQFCGTYYDITAPTLVNGVDDGWMNVGPFGEDLAIHPFLGAQPGGSETFVVTDQNGCQFNNHVTFGWPVDFPAITILNISGACSGQANGSVLFSHTAEGHGQQTLAYLRRANGQIAQSFGLAGTADVMTVTGLLPGDYWLRQYVYPIIDGSPEFNNTCGDSILVSIPDLGTTCGNVNGTVYMDYNEDCVMGYSGVETRVPGALLEFQPGPYYATANASGAYSINLPTGAYTMQQIATGIAQHCPPPPSPVNVSGVQTLHVGDTALVPLDAQVTLTHGPARPGFQLQYAIEQANLTPATTGNTSTVFTFEPVLSFVSAFPAPTNISGNVLTWDQAALGAFGVRSIQVHLQVPPDISLVGTVLNASVSFSCANADVDLDNNITSSPVTVTASYDPNDKRAFTSTGSTSIWTIDEDEWIDYTIRFQNTGTDTAFNVVITDTLPETLDPASITWGAGSHAHSRALIGQGVLKFIFPNILLPDSNVDEPGSHGFVGFRIRPRLPITPGTVIENIANIYFDYNPPVITEPSVLVAEFSTVVRELGEGGVQLFPNPATNVLNIRSMGMGLSEVMIIASDGRVAGRTRVQGAAIALDIGHLKAGVYTVEILTDGGLTHIPFIKH